jgi:hypothetical protein
MASVNGIPEIGGSLAARIFIGYTCDLRNRVRAPGIFIRHGSRGASAGLFVLKFGERPKAGPVGIGGKVGPRKKITGYIGVGAGRGVCGRPAYGVAVHFGVAGLAGLVKDAARYVPGRLLS